MSDGGHPSEGVAPLERALSLDPDFHEARFNLAVAHARAGDRPGAVRQAEELLKRLFSRSTVLDVDYTHSDGRDLGVRWPLNTRIPVPAGNGARRYADLPLNPANPTMNMSIGQSQYDGINFGVRRRMTNGIQLNAWYTLAKATGRGGQAVDC